ncbi:hypothetical protein OCU04_007882 [Sclerotinia nivalis]|uniref:Uncharacterized protein n=1 Tax=Sclerotinia nivalis TaxID=352851 RepID=A0A9X0AJP9_9HELO|nr:hypothetical protein OCU04_007882 [Sclerotinia nivalis]
MTNPFARPREYLPSMNRQGITVWAHDVINELVRLGALDSGNEEASNDLFGVYKNLEQFYKWVCSRPRIAPHHAPRPLQSITRPFGIFALAHKLWDNLEWELRPEKEGAFIEQMIDHLGWFWNIKANLSNKIRRKQGLALISKMDTLAEAASYALRFSNISRGNIIKPPMARPDSSVDHLMSKVAPASRKNPINVGAWSPESRIRQKNPSNNTMRSDQASSFATPTQKTDTGHLKLPQYSQYVQRQPQASMRCSPSSYNTQQLNPRSTIQRQSHNFPNGTPRNLVDLVDDDDDYSSAKQTGIPRVPTGSMLPAPPIRGDKHPNRAQGFAGGSMRPIMNMSGVKPAVDNDSHHANPSAFRTSSRDLKDSHGGRESTQPKNSPYDSGFEESVESSNTNMIIIVDSPSPELKNMTMKNPGPQGHKNHPTSAVVSSEDSKALERPSSRNILPVQTKTKTPPGQSSFQANLWAPVNSLNNHREVRASESAKVRGQPSDRRSDEQESRNTRGTKLKKPNSTSINKGIITDNNMEGTEAKNSTSTNGTRHDMEGNNIDNSGEATMKGAISITSTHNNITGSSMGETKAKRPTSANGNQENSSGSPNKKVKTSANSTAPSSEYVSPYISLPNQEQPSTSAKSTTLAAVDEPVSEKPVSENSSSISPIVRNAKGLYRPFSMRDPVKKDGSDGN